MNEKQEAVFDAIALDYRKAGKELRKLFESALDAAKELEEPEFNILDVLPVGSPVECETYKGARIKRIYAGGNKCLINGNASGESLRFDNIVPDPDAKNVLAFKVHDGGDCPVRGDVQVIYITQAGRRSRGLAHCLTWNYASVTIVKNCIVLYSVIE